MNEAGMKADLTPRIREAVWWKLLGNLGFNPVARYMGLMFNDWVGADYEKGLAKLKRVVESAPPAGQPAPAAPQTSG